MSPGLALRAGTALGLFWFHILRFRRREVEAALERALGLPEPQRRDLARANFVHYGRLVLEFLRLPNVVRDGTTGLVTFHGREHLDQALAGGKGVLLLGGHIGNYDLLAVAVALQGYPLTIVSKSLRNKAVEKVWMSQRAASGLHIALHRNTLREIVKALRHNGAVGFVIDQHARTDAVVVDFFDRPAATLRSLATIAERTGAPVVPIVAIRQEDGSHEVTIGPPVPLEVVGDADANARHNTQRFTAILEAEIRRHPDQWTWMHRRWKVPTSTP
jgi:KDO2-lipid IV(A) lauroyltransferase